MPGSQADAFVAQLQEAMKSALDTLDRELPRNPSVKIQPIATALPGIVPPEPTCMGEVVWLEPYPDQLLAQDR